MSKQAASGSAGALVMLAAAAAALCGAFLPWATASLGPLAATLRGASGFHEGPVTAACAGVAGLAALANLAARRTLLAALAALGFAGAFAASAYAELNLSGAGAGVVAVRTGYGLWLCLLGSLAGLVAGLLALGSRSALSPAASLQRRPPARRSLESALRPPPGTPASWLEDPTGQHLYRWFDGSSWTAWVSDGDEPRWAGGLA